MVGIMTHVGLLQDGKLSPAARQSYIDETASLLENGTGDFLFGGLPADLQFTGNSGLAEGFKKDTLEEHQASFPRFHQVWLDEMYQQIAISFDVPCGGGSLPPPIIDPTVAFPDLKLKANVGLPDLLLPPTPDIFDIELDPVQLAEFNLNIPIEIAKAKINVPLPPIPPPPPIVIPPPPVPNPLPTIPLPPVDVDINAQLELNAFLNIPTIPIPPAVALQPLSLPYLLFYNCVIFVGIPLIIAALIAEGPGFITALADGFPVGIIAFVLTVVLAAVGGCLGVKLSGQILSFVAAFLVLLKKLVLMLIVLIVGQLIGQGLVSKLVSSGIGLT